MLPLQGKTLVLCVMGGIAAFKAVELASRFVKLGATVDVIMTEAAQEFIRPLSFQSLTKRPVITDMFRLLSDMNIGHVALGERADVVVIAPATANTIAKLAAGLSDDMLTCTVLATTAPVVVVAAMNDLMYANVATQENVVRLRERGFTIVEPEYGRLASGKMGKGRMVEVPEIVGVVRGVLGRNGDFAGKRVVVTAGGTREPIDPVRYITNRSSGRMGYALAESARDRGARVTLITTPSTVPRPTGVEVVQVLTAREMLDAVLRACEGAHVLVMAAAVADFRVAQTAPEKIKKGESEEVQLTLVRNPDILQTVGERFGEGLPVKVGFAAETESLVANAREKLVRKRLDLVVANDVTKEGSGFGTETNEVVLVDAEVEEELPLLSKYEVALRVLDAARRALIRKEAAAARSSEPGGGQ